METKSQKELAFLYDLYIGTDWAERFAALVDEQVQLPKEGRALYIAAGTGGHALARDGQMRRHLPGARPAARASHRDARS